MSFADKSAFHQFVTTASSADHVSAFGESLTSFRNSIDQLGGGGSRDSSPMEVDDAVVFGLDTVQVTSHDAICCGAVGKEGKTMCIKRNCRTESHRVKCQHPFVPVIYLKKGQDKVHIDPYVVVSPDLSPSHQTEIMNTKFSVQTWAKLAHTRDMAAHKGVSLDEAQDLIKRKREIFKTPARSNKRVTDHDIALEGFDKFLDIHQKFEAGDDGPLAVSLLEEKLAEVKSQLSDTSTPNEVFASILPTLLEIARQLSQDRNLMDINRDHVQFLSKFTKEETTRIEDSTNTLKVDVETLMTTIGEMGAMSHHPKSILCEAIDSLHGMLMKVGVTEAADKDQPLLTHVEMESFLNHVEILLTGLNKRLEVIEQTSGDPHQNGGLTLPSQGLSGHEGTISDVDRAWKAQVDEAIKNLKVNASQPLSTERGFSYESYHFPDMEEFQAWLEVKEGASIVPLALFQSWPTLFHRIFKDLTGESRSIRDIQAINAMDMRDNDANSAEALGMMGMPHLFKGKDGKFAMVFSGLNTGGAKSRFRGCPTKKVWGKLSQHDGLRYKAEEALVRVQKNIREDIERVLKSPEVKSLCLSMLLSTVEFIKSLFAYMTDTYEELETSFGDENKTWDFTCKCVEDVLTTEFSESRAIAPGMDFGDSTFTLRMIWCSLQILTVQQKFMDVGIANHSTLSATYSRFLIKNSQTGDIASIKKELEAAKKQNSKLEERVKDLEAKVKAATGAADKAAQSVRALQNQMKGKNSNNSGN